ncbi:MAG: hypothetical protein JW715_04430 [Sedimentisphaerales bacterium]|nr:hypothetical protein [Sedimentisphaerales bacterium]
MNMMGNVKHKTGFSLIEVLIAIIFIGIAIASLVASNSAFTQANGAGTNLSTAEFLSEQIRELTAMLKVSDPDSTSWTNFGAETGETLADFDDLDDFDGKTFSPPIGAQRNTLNDFAAFSQQITVENVNPSDFEDVVADRTSDFVRVTVKVFLNSEQVSTTSWLRCRY